MTSFPFYGQEASLLWGTNRSTSLCRCLSIAILHNHLMSFSITFLDEVVPYFKTEPRAEQTHLEGNRLVLTCLAEGSWPLSFRWLFNGSQLTQYSPVYRFVIPSLDRSHAGSYQCVVRNRAGALMQRPTEIHVAYMGKFDGGRRRQGVWQGQAAVLTPPHIPSYPQPQVTWFHEGQKISPSARISSQEGTETPPFSLHSAVTMENQLVVLATAAADAGRYRVQAVNERNGENKTSQELELDVEDASSPADPVAPEIVVAPRNMSVRFGTEGVTLECVANARPIDLLTLEWWRGSRKVMEGVSSWGRRLSLPTLTSVHGGSYECRALLRGSRVPSASAFAHLTITEQPVFIQEPEGHTVGEVESVVELPCKAIGVPPPKLTWFKDGDRLLIQRDPRVSLTPNGGLRIRALEPGDTGIFQCWAQNMAGMTQSYTHLSVTSVAASIMRGPADAVVIARTIVELPCEAHGAPRPSVAWERDGVVLVSGSMQTPRYVLLETGGLRIDPALRSDSGTFTCIVANSQGQDQATATLTVWERTRISIPPIDQSVIKDATVTFLCGVIHDPSVTVRFSWEKDGKRLEFATGSRRSLTSENALVISQAWSGDRGVYTCHAASAGGNASHNARLDVWERPSEPQDVRATQAKGRVVALTWVQPFDGNTELTGYQVEVSENESPWRMLPLNVNPDVTRVAVHDLVPGWTYQFRLQAVNKVGYGPNSQATERIFLPEESPGEPPQHLFIHEILSTSLDVRWLPPPYRYRHGKIRGYLIRYQPVGLSGEFQVQNVSGGDKTSFILVDLLQWAAYEVAVAAYTAIGPGPYSPSSTSWTLQGAPRVPPRDVKAEVISSTSIKLSWLPPSPDTIPGIILGYKLLSWPTSSTDAVETVTIAPGNTESRVSGELKGLRKFTAYDTAVVCFTWPGDGPPSPSIRLRTLEDRPGPVAQLNFSYVLDTSVRVSWLPPFEANGFIVGYHVSWEQPGQPGSLKNRMLPSSARDLIITGLSPLIIYAITVSAQTVIGQGPPSSATISSGVPPELPGAPTNLAISNIGPHSVILQFRAGYGGKTSVSRWLVEAEVKHEEETEGWQQVFELAGGPDARSIEVPGLAPFTHYRFRMRQTNIVGTSPASHPSRHVQTLQAPPYMAPANLSVHASGKNSLLLRWAPLPESSYNALPDTVGYRLQYRHLRAVNRRPDVAEMTWVSIALAGKVSQSNELGGLQKSGSTEVRRETRKPVGKKKSTKIEVQWVVVTDRLERELKLEGLQPWSLYELRIQAFNSISAGPWGQPVRGRTREDVPSAGPENISVVATGPHTLLVTWGAIPEGSKNGWILGYKVLTSNPAEPVPPLDSVATAAQESIVNVSGLQAATLYKLTVLAYTQVGDGVPTDPAVTCHTMEDLPGRPGAVWFPEVSSHAVRLAWQPPPQPNGQILGYRASLLANGSGSNPERTWELGSDVKQVRAAGLAPETRYTFLLAAQTSRGWGSPAEVVIITTQHRGRPAPPGRPWADAKTLGPRTLLLKWAAGAGGFAPVRYYILHSQKMSAGVWQPLASTLPPQPTEFLVNWLEPFTDYLFRLTAINDVGESEPSETSQTVTTLQDVPSKPPTLLAVRPVSPTSLLLQWQRAYLLVTVENADSKKPTSATATSSLSQSTIESTFAPPPPAGSMNGLLLGYSLRYQQRPSPQEPNPIPGPIIQLTSDPQPPPLAPTMLKTVNDSSLTEYKLQGLERYRHYEVRLSVYNSAGEGPPSDPWEVYVGEALPTAPPRGLHLLSATATQLHLSWQPPQKNNGENDILAYKVYCRKAGSAASSEEKTVRLLKNNVRLGSLLSFTSYLVSVVTVNSAGEGPRSQALQARTLQAAPSAPAYLHFTKMTSSSVNVTWGMPIQPNGLITGFRVIYQPTSPVNGISKIVTVDVPGSSRKWLLIKDLTEGETYMVGVCARTLAYGPEISGNITAGPAHGAPGPPAEPWVQLDEETVTVHWVEGDPGNSPVSGYIIEARASDEGLWELVARNLPASAQSHTIPLLQFHSDTSYAFRVFARNAHGLGSPSPPSPAISARVHMGFYEEWWFLVVVALCSFGFVVLLVFGLLARGQNRKYARKSDSGNTPRMGAEELTSLDGGFPALEMESRRLPIKSGLSIKPGLSFKPPLSIKPGLQRRNGTQPRSPPRPSPGTLHYSDEELMPYEVTREAEPPPDLTESQQVKDEDFPPDIAKEQPHSFVNHYISDPSYYHSWNRKPKVFSHSEDQAQLVVAAGVGQALQRGLYVCTANGRPPDAPGPPTGLSSFV